MESEMKKIASRIKDLREVFELTEAQMAEITKVSLEQYLKAERGEVDFTFGFLHRLAKYFEIDIAELISGDSPKLKGFQIVRKGEGMPLERRKGFTYLHLAPFFREKKAEPFMVTAKYRKEEQEREIPISMHNDQEFDLIIRGKLKFVINGTETILSEGDSAYYDANLPHGMIAYEEDCQFLSVIIKQELKTETNVDDITKVVQNNLPTKHKVYEDFIKTYEDDNGKLLNIEFCEKDNYNFAYDVVDKIGEKDPNKVAMLWLSKAKQKRVFTFAELSKLSNKCANYFTSIGIKKGDKVMLVLKRHYQFWIAILALHKLGAVTIPATNLLTEKDFTYRFDAGDVVAVVCTTDGITAEECEKSLLSEPRNIVKIATGEREGWQNFDIEIEKFSDKMERVETHKSEPMLMYFTSGTTGYPKIAAQAHTYSLGHFVTAKYWHNVDEDGVHLTISDTGWGKAVWGKLYGQWLNEATVFTYDFDKFDANDILPLFKEYNITTFCAPPTMYRFFIKEDLAKYDLSSLKTATIAGEALNPEVYEQFFKATGLKLMEGFGQTETTLTVANLKGTVPKPGSMGKPNPQYDIDIIDKDGVSAKVGEVGEIVVKTDKKIPYGLFLGYYKNQDKTNDVWKNNAYHTGDMAWKDEDGYFWYVGRDDDLIKSSGYRIGPFEIESVIMELPYVLECAVVGAPHETRGQVVKAVIVLKGSAPSEEIRKEIQDYVKHHTAPYKYPRIIEFRESLPKTISGKIIRNEIR